MTKNLTLVISILAIGVVIGGAVLLMGSTDVEAREEGGPKVCTDMMWECNIAPDGDVECHNVPGSGCLPVD